MIRRPLDPDMTAFLASIRWPEGTPAPSFELAIVDGAPLVLLVAGEREAMAPAGVNHFDLLRGIGEAAESLCRAHGCEPGVWPTGVRAQIVLALDLRTAAAWHYRIQVAAALVAAEAAR